MSIIKLAPNVPEPIELRYADLKEGKLWEGKQLPPQLQLKGQGKDGQDRIIYVPVECASELLKAGASAIQTEKGTTYKPVGGWWTVEKRQLAGEKYGTVYLYRNGSGPSPTAAPTPNEPPPPQNPDAEDSAAPNRDEQLVTLYTDSLKRAMHICKVMNALPDPPFVFTASDVAAMTATLFISRSRAAGF